MNFENCAETKTAVPVCNTPQTPNIKTYTDDLGKMLTESIVELTNIVQFITGDKPNFESKVDVGSLETAARKNCEMASALRMGIDMLAERLGAR